MYWRNDVDLIEPIRSARVYYLDWAAELDAVFVHHGFAQSWTAADVPSALLRLGIRDLDGFYLGSAVGERDPDRPSPHNVRSSSGLLWATAAAFGFSGPPNLQPWAFKEDQPQLASDPAARAAAAIDLSFGGPFSASYAVRWDYDPAANAYLRSVAGSPHSDGLSGRRIAAKNVVVQITSIYPAGDDVHLLVETSGEGPAVVFQDGIAHEGSWRKEGPYGRTRFYDSAGNEIAFNRGPTWIEVLAYGSLLAY